MIIMTWTWFTHLDGNSLPLMNLFGIWTIVREFSSPNTLWFSELSRWCLKSLMLACMKRGTHRSFVKNTAGLQYCNTAKLIKPTHIHERPHPRLFELQIKRKKRVFNLTVLLHVFTELCVTLGWGKPFNSPKRAR